MKTDLDSYWQDMIVVPPTTTRYQFDQPYHIDCKMKHDAVRLLVTKPSRHYLPSLDHTN